MATQIREDVHETSTGLFIVATYFPERGQYEAPLSRLYTRDTGLRSAVARTIDVLRFAGGVVVYKSRGAANRAARHIYEGE